MKLLLKLFLKDYHFHSILSSFQFSNKEAVLKGKENEVDELRILDFKELNFMDLSKLKKWKELSVAVLIEASDLYQLDSLRKNLLIKLLNIKLPLLLNDKGLFKTLSDKNKPLRFDLYLSLLQLNKHKLKLMQSLRKGTIYYILKKDLLDTIMKKYNLSPDILKDLIC